MNQKPLQATRERISPNPYVFIVGCPRSGTTLLQRIVDAHPQMAIINETRWIAKTFHQREGLTPEGLVTSDLVRKLVEYKRFSQLEIAWEELEQLIGCGEPMGNADFVSKLFDHYAARHGKRFAGDKTPGYARWLPTLHALRPRVKFVHLIRDGRDVCLSALAWVSDDMKDRYPTWHDNPVFTAAMWRKRNVRLAREAGRKLTPDLYYEMRYEALVARPVEECQALCDYLGVAYDPLMVRFHEARRTDGGRERRRDRLPITPGLRNWKSQMSAEDVERFEAAAGDLLDELGCERALPQPSEGIRQQASSIRNQFAQRIGARGRWLPEQW